MSHLLPVSSLKVQRLEQAANPYSRPYSKTQDITCLVSASLSSDPAADLSHPQGLSDRTSVRSHASSSQPHLLTKARVLPVPAGTCPYPQVPARDPPIPPAQPAEQRSFHAERLAVFSRNASPGTHQAPSQPRPRSAIGLSPAHPPAAQRSRFGQAPPAGGPRVAAVPARPSES